MHTMNRAPGPTASSRRIGRRMRRRLRAVRRHEWLQYFGLLMLVVGAVILTSAALSI